MCPCNEEQQQTTDHFIFHCTKLRNQKNEMINQIKNAGGTWPTTNETLANNYLPIFVKFIKSLDFTVLQ
jgi:hypothetical protein